MAEPTGSINNNILATEKPNDRENPGAESAEKSPFRRIEFHLARKPFTGFTKGGGGGGDGIFRLETLNPTTTSSKDTRENHQQRVGSDLVGGGSLGKKRDASELENGLDPELSFGITFRRIGAGLENLGNTCFLNSVLQCLTYTEPLAAYLQSGKHQITCRNAGFCALCAIQKHVSRALQSSGRSLAPKDLVSNLRCISRTFRNSRQEDAHEYMVNLLESMHKCCLPKGVPSESPNAYDRSLVHKIFGGRLRSQVKCMQCNYCSNKFDPFLDLSLEILKADNLYKAFANFTAKEQLDGGAKQYQCQQCRQKVKALKQLTIHKAPNVLTIHLKRFGSHVSGQKIDKKIQFGPTLDLKPFVTGPYDGDLKYTLYGVLVHAGWSTHSGHYYCFVRTSSGMWYSLDDNRVIQVSEKKVFEQKAYMLFYFRDRKDYPSRKPPADVVCRNGTVNGVGPNNTRPVNVVLSNGPSSSAAGISTRKDTQTSFILSNGTSNGADAPKEPEKGDGPVRKSVSEAQLERNDDVETNSNGVESSKKEESVTTMLPEFKEKRSGNDDFSAAAAVTKPLTTPGDEVGGNESFGGDDRQKAAVAVAASDSPKTGTCLNRKPHKKPKKNFLKCKVTSMKFSANILMGASRKKKKHKRSGRSNPIEEGPSPSSVKVDTIRAVVAEDKNIDVSVKRVENELKERDGAVLATSIERSQPELKGTDGGKSAWTQKELVHMLTRGLDDRTVPRWDENESTQSQIRQTKGALTIGYVGDEWDEEYDRGRRKKVRMSKTEFDGENPFQDISNERLRSNRKHDGFGKSSSGNRPFRI